MFNKKDYKNQGAERANVKSKQELINYLNHVVARINNNEPLCDQFRNLILEVESFPTCADPRALKLDELIKGVVDDFFESQFKYSSTLLSNTEKGKIKIEQYEAANNEIFALICPILGDQLVSRNSLMNGSSQKAVKGKEVDEEVKKWEMQQSVINFTIKYRKLFYERQILLKEHSLLKEKLLTDKMNREYIASQLEQLDEDLENINRHELIIAKQIAKNKMVMTAFDDLNIEKFITDHNYGREKMAECFSKIAQDVKRQAASRANEDKVFDEINESKKEFLEKTTPRSASTAKSKYLIEAEEHDAITQSEKLKDGGGNESQPTRAFDKERK